MGGKSVATVLLVAIVAIFPWTVRNWFMFRTLVPGAVLVYPLVYYLSDVYARYRYPIEPFLMVFAGYALSRAFEFRRSRVA